MQKICTLIFVEREGEVLLGYKKRGFGADRWNGFGGKLEEGESLEEAAIREMREECGIELKNLKKTALMIFTHDEDARPHLIHVFKTSEFEGEPMETEEMKPAWFALDDIPYDDMWEDDRHWLRRMLDGEHLIGHFHFKNYTDLLSHNLQSVDENHFSC